MQYKYAVQQYYVHVINIKFMYPNLQGTFLPLYGASQGGLLAIVEVLVSRGAGIDKPCDVRFIFMCMLSLIIKVIPTA